MIRVFSRFSEAAGGAAVAQDGSRRDPTLSLGLEIPAVILQERMPQLPPAGVNSIFSHSQLDSTAEVLHLNDGDSSYLTWVPPPCCPASTQLLSMGRDAQQVFLA